MIYLRFIPFLLLSAILTPLHCSASSDEEGQTVTTVVAPDESPRDLRASNRERQKAIIIEEITLKPGKRKPSISSSEDGALPKCKRKRKSVDTTEYQYGKSWGNRKNNKKRMQLYRTLRRQAFAKAGIDEKSKNKEEKQRVVSQFKEDWKNGVYNDTE